MSSLIFTTEPDVAVVATDTLTTSLDGKPFMFTTKALIVPHLRMIIAGTGAGGFLDKWFIKINSQMVLSGIDNLDYHAPSGLMSLWKGHKQEFSIPDKITTTVYHFGFSEENDRICTYVYRLINNFHSESLQYGTGVKPECNVPEQNMYPHGIKAMMDEQRANQSLLPKEERVYIGGEIQIHMLSRQGFYVNTVDKFDDYDIDRRAIYENFRPVTHEG